MYREEERKKTIRRIKENEIKTKRNNAIGIQITISHVVRVVL
jgi:hypothetical protein